MANGTWSKQWTILDSEGKGGLLIPPGAQFTLDPQPSSGQVAYYVLRAGQAVNKCLDGTLFYPVGTRDLTVSALKKWDSTSTASHKEYMDAAKSVKNNGRGDVLATRLEGTFTSPAGAKQVVRLYRFTGARPIEKRDWIVADIVSADGNPKNPPPSPPKSGPITASDGDGTGHGDP
jgi:hypothetical protein